MPPPPPYASNSRDLPWESLSDSDSDLRLSLDLGAFDEPVPANCQPPPYHPVLDPPPFYVETAPTPGNRAADEQHFTDTAAASALALPVDQNDRLNRRRPRPEHEQLLNKVSMAKGKAIKAAKNRGGPAVETTSIPEVIALAELMQQYSDATIGDLDLGSGYWLQEASAIVSRESQPITSRTTTSRDTEPGSARPSMAANSPSAGLGQVQILANSNNDGGLQPNPARRRYPLAIVSGQPRLSSYSNHYADREPVADLEINVRAMMLDHAELRRRLESPSREGPRPAIPTGFSIDHICDDNCNIQSCPEVRVGMLQSYQKVLNARENPDLIAIEEILNKPMFPKPYIPGHVARREEEKKRKKEHRQKLWDTIMLKHLRTCTSPSDNSEGEAGSSSSSSSRKQGQGRR